MTKPSLMHPEPKTWRRWFRPVRPTTWTGPWPASSRLFDVAILLWLIFAAALTVKGLLNPLEHTNYTAYESGGTRWWAELNTYDEATGVDYRYGPAFTVLLTPLVSLPFWLGGLVFAWLNLVVFYFALRALIRHVLPGTWSPDQQAAYFLLLLLAGTRMHWAIQINPTLISLVAFAAVAIVEQRWWWAAFLLALPVHIKVYPVAVAMLLVACWPRQLGWRFAVSLVLVGLVPFLTKPPSYVWSQYQEWFNVLFGRAQIRHVYRDAWTIWEMVYPPVSVAAYQVLQLAMAAVTLGLCLWQKRRGVANATLVTFVVAIWLVWQMVFGPAIERNTFGLIAPMTCWGVVLAFEEKRGRIWTGAAYLLTAVLANGNVERALVPLFQCAHPVGVLLFAGWLVWWAGCRQQDVRSSSPGRAAKPGVSDPPILQLAVAWRANISPQSNPPD
jgi:hypothetical protein